MVQKMPGKALTFAMTASRQLTPEKLGDILTKVTKSNAGSELERLYDATSWSSLLFPGIGILGTIGKTIGGTVSSAVSSTIQHPIQALQSAGKAVLNPRKAIQDTLGTPQQIMNEVINDPDFPKFIEQNQPLMICALKHVLSDNATEATKASRSISSFVEVLPALVKTLQERGCLRDTTDMGGMLQTVCETLINDAASPSTSSEQQNLYLASLKVSEKFLEMTAAHPLAAQHLIGRLVTSTKSPSHQDEMLRALSTFKVDKAVPSKGGPDGRKRKDFSTLCTKYRETEKPDDRMAMDTALEYHMHQYNFADLELTANTIANDMHIEGFSFRDTKLMRGFPPQKSCFVNCDFSFAFLEDGVSFKECVIDADTFATLLPSLRVAKAEGKNISLSGLVIAGDISTLNLSHIDLTGVAHLSTTPNALGISTRSMVPLQHTSTNTHPPLSSREIINRKAIAIFGDSTWLSLSAPKKQEFIQQVPAKGWFDLGRTTRAQRHFTATLETMYNSILVLSDIEQAVIVHTLTHNTQIAQECANEINKGEEGPKIFEAHVKKIRSDPEFTRQYLRATQKPELDPFTNELLSQLHSLSETERHVLTTISQENVAVLSKVYDSAPGSAKDKAAQVLQEIKTLPKFKFRKEVQEFKPKAEYFKERHIESMRSLFIDIGCGPFLDTVEYESVKKNPPTIFGTAFQKTLCFLFPNLRNLFGVNTKFGRTLASRSFLQICKLTIYSIRHPQKMMRTLKDSVYVMDQIGWITWKEPRDIAGAQQELVTKLVATNVVGEFLRNQRLPSLACSVTDLFPNIQNAAQAISVGQKFYHALEETSVTRQFKKLMKGPQALRNQILAPFLSMVIRDEIIKDVNPETVVFLTDNINKALATKDKAVITAAEVQAVVDAGAKLSSLLKKYKIVEEIDALLSASNTQRFEILKKTIHNPNDLADIIMHIEEMQRTVQPIIGKAALQWNTKKLDKTGMVLWYEPDQAKLEKVMKVKQADPSTAVNLNQEFRACSFGNIRIVGTEAQPINWTNVQAHKFDMWGATITHVNFDGSQLTGYSNPITSQFYFKGASFDHAKMAHCSLNDVKLTHAYMQDVQMTECQAANLDLSHADMMYSTLDASEFTNASFKKANFYGAYIVGCRVEDSDFSKSTCEHAIFRSTFAGKTNFKNADLKNAIFTGSVFNGDVNMRGAILLEAQFDHLKVAKGATIDIEGAIITDALLEQLKKSCPNQIKNADKAVTLKESTIKNFSTIDIHG